MSGKEDVLPPPVFVVGSARSGTTLLYHTLLSTGGYAVYRGEPAVFDLLQPRYGDLGSRHAQRRLLREWPQSHLARASGLDSPEACRAMLRSVRSTGDFLRAVMTRLAAQQGLTRWAVWGPDNLLLIAWIKRELPNARFVHMVRDGRDVALSIGTEGWIHPFPWDRGREVLVAALHWEWKVQRGRRCGERVGADYLEMHFEDLVDHSTSALRRLSDFLGHPIDPASIQRRSLGTLGDPNSTFRLEASAPVGRWRERMPRAKAAELEQAIGATLTDFGYELETGTSAAETRLPATLYPRWFSMKHFLRTHTPLGRLVDPQRLRLAAPATDTPLDASGMSAEPGSVSGAARSAGMGEAGQ